jgi:hypothetical protein
MLSLAQHTSCCFDEPRCCRILLVVYDTVNQFYSRAVFDRKRSKFPDQIGKMYGFDLDGHDCFGDSDTQIPVYSVRHSLIDGIHFLLHLCLIFLEHGGERNAILLKSCFLANSPLPPVNCVG